MRADEVRERMAGTVFGSVRFVGTTGSTNADLLAAARDGASEGLVLVADHQTAGRGRHGRSWVAPPGAALLASVLLRPQAGSAALTLLSPAVGLAVRDACADVGADVQLKWPNDVIARVPGEAGAPGEAKLAGVLAESDVAGGTAAVVAGFGVNLLSHPALSATVAAQVGETERDFAPLPPTALDALAVLPPSRDELLISVLVRLDAWYRRLR
ncbi:MAG: biotin--[acetyl-CoA-carboxylase] ligase, partial [bacterium]|nr:biotin--[acetyl-CoA-carboxylase] ligase [bacterium]